MIVTVTKESDKSLSIDSGSYKKSFTALFGAAGSGAGIVTLRGMDGFREVSITESYQNFRIVADGETVTPTSEADCVAKLSRFINFRSSGGTGNTPVFYHSSEATLAGFIANDTGLGQLTPGMYVVLNGANPIQLYLYVGGDPDLASSYALVSVSSIMWENIEGKPTSSPAAIDYAVENAAVEGLRIPDGSNLLTYFSGKPSGFYSANNNESLVNGVPDEVNAFSYDVNVLDSSSWTILAKSYITGRAYYAVVNTGSLVNGWLPLSGFYTKAEADSMFFRVQPPIPTTNADSFSFWKALGLSMRSIQPDSIPNQPCQWGLVRIYPNGINDLSLELTEQGGTGRRWSRSINVADTDSGWRQYSFQ